MNEKLNNERLGVSDSQEVSIQPEKGNGTAALAVTHSIERYKLAVKKIFRKDI